MNDTPNTGIETLINRLKGLLHQLHQAMIQARRSLDRDVEHRMNELATESSARYVLQHMLTAKPVRAKPGDVDAHELLRFALSLVSVEGFIAEFGVHTGGSINLIADRVPGPVYGFDSFEGLPEDWHLSFGRGQFDMGGRLPDVRSNVQLMKGWFSDTLPEFTKLVSKPAAFLHIDCDLYSSTKTVLECLSDRIIPGTILVFDEYFNYPGWERHEALAFSEFCQANGVSYRYVAFAPTGNSVAVVVEGRANCPSR